ncbi:GNAT family N-acetyltransferase [Pullulanibacillus sp. KACC 23026]|uniref:GNAT family N-acetyltransferase n=1 Tax=Pullulanibacillus sp. KACC 23026 TaxID=3028315 RepID=UPI0023AEE3F9|nr:GNAT family N-acetyltransferase [Pullulanibacillus sp. KACC 23026]WEG14930.1 GNAT family N-acetyltransferase [Pullulanibacillus sp. KACC 23026]
MSFSEKPIKAIEIIKLYDLAGWWEEREEQEIEKMLGSEVSVGAWKDEVLIGFARAVTDGKFRAYIEDVVIHNDYQKQGIGLKPISRLLDELTHIDIISLFCEEELIPFYEKNGFDFSKSQFVLHRKAGNN